MTMPLDTEISPPSGGGCQLPDYLLALLEERGFISNEQAYAVLELTEKVVSLGHDETVALLREVFESMPPWETCLSCKTELAAHKVRIINWHNANHPLPQ